jgi:antitoxin VapB
MPSPSLTRRTQLLLDDELHQRLRETAAQRGVSMGALIREAVEEKLARTRRPSQGLAADLEAIGLRCAALPVLDERAEDEILGYDEQGLPR